MLAARSHRVRMMRDAPSLTRAATGFDQAQLPIYRYLALVQVAAAGFFGIYPFLFPDSFASVFGYEGAEPFVYRLLGAASTGYAAAAILAFRRPIWAEHRIPIVASLTFNAAAVLATLLALLIDGEPRFLVFFILVAASVFSLITAYWLVRDEGPAAPDSPRVTAPVRVLLAVATLAALAFGVLPLLIPNLVASATGFAVADLFIYRLAGAATLGYATAGVLEVRARAASEIRLQVRAALVFNVLSAIAAVIYLIGGGQSPIGWVILVAATGFSVAAGWWLAATPESATNAAGA